MRRALVPATAIILMVAAGCAREQRHDVSSTRTAPQARPWTSAPSAEWVRAIARRAGYRVTGSTGSAWIAEGGGRSFYIWATEASGSIEQIAEGENYRLVARFDGAPVHDDGVRKLWAASGHLFWVEAGPYAESRAPSASELRPLVRASRTLKPPG